MTSGAMWRGEVGELHIDRVYLAGTCPRQLHEAGVAVFSKPWSSSSERFGEAAFSLDVDNGIATAPPAGT